MKGSVAVITGAAAGLGRAYAERLRAAGVQVVALDLRFEDRLQGVTTYELDVAEPAEVTAAIDAVESSFGRVDILVCNAGGGSGSQSENQASQVHLDDFHRVLDVNLFGTVHCCSAVAPMMKRHGKGAIVTVSSEAGLLPSVDGGYAHYGVAKAAVAMYTRYLARELGPYGIRANCIAPGPIGTPRLMRRFEETGVDQIAAQYPLRRLGRVEDCAAAVEFLADDARSGWISGRVIQIDGGGVECWKV